MSIKEFLRKKYRDFNFFLYDAVPPPPECKNCPNVRMSTFTLSGSNKAENKNQLKTGQFAK